MIVVWLILIPMIGGLVAWWSERRGPHWPRWISSAALGVDLILGLALWGRSGSRLELSETGQWLAEFNAPWIPPFGISFHLALDGLSLLFVLLTAFLGLMAVIASWTEIQERIGLFHLALLATLAGVLGVFLAMDLFLFFVFWEVMLVPMYFLISVWGHEDRVYAAIKFFLFTQLGGLFMLVAILALAFIHHAEANVWTFDYPALLETAIPPATAWWLMLGFFAAFAVKLPAVPLHTWLPDAHTQASTGGSIILAGLLLKTGAYGLLRFAVPLFPDAAHSFAPVAMALGVLGILYGAVLAFAQDDVKRLVAYSSISHLGFVLLGIFAWTPLALQGSVIQMIAHGFSTGALFMLAGAIQERLHTRDMRQMQGLWSAVPKMAALALFFAVASLGLPGVGNFVGEFLVLVGAYQVNVPLTVLATVGLVAATIYSLVLMQRTFYGPPAQSWHLRDLSARALVMFGAVVALEVWLGLYPQPTIDTARPALASLQAVADRAMVSQR